MHLPPWNRQDERPALIKQRVEEGVKRRGRSIAAVHFFICRVSIDLQLCPMFSKAEDDLPQCCIAWSLPVIF